MKKRVQEQWLDTSLTADTAMNHSADSRVKQKALPRTEMSLHKLRRVAVAAVVAIEREFLGRHLLLFGFCCLLFSCAELKSGKHADVYSALLSSDDIQQIKALAASRPDVRLHVSEIKTEQGRSDRAMVYTGRWLKVGDESEYFEVEKQHGRWRIISRVKRDRVRAENIMTVS